jgi:hypothetical protein
LRRNNFKNEGHFGKGAISMSDTNGEKLDPEVRDILLVSGGAALIVFGAGLIMAHPLLRQSAKSAFGALLPQLEGPVRDSIKGVLPDVERYLRLKGM